MINFALAARGLNELIYFVTKSEAKMCRNLHKALLLRPADLNTCGPNAILIPLV
jgi:hypothetical protein